MGIDKNKYIIKELEFEVEILRNKILEQKETINNLTKNLEEKENIIQKIINSRTFKFVDKLNKILKRKV